ncbi:hypothetical protein N7535_009109 [Penicillium sp. DV-2018c]|nr:hypothetical protein N7535_009109 [Penicillium sp. DV-2018c]
MEKHENEEKPTTPEKDSQSPGGGWNTTYLCYTYHDILHDCTKSLFRIILLVFEIFDLGADYLTPVLDRTEGGGWAVGEEGKKTREKGDERV